MPRAALRAVPQAHTLPLERVTPYLISLATSDESARPRRGHNDEARA
jgi:hypothetical protein